jgi:hypothetical protein
MFSVYNGLDDRSFSSCHRPSHALVVGQPRDFRPKNVLRTLLGHGFFRRLHYVIFIAPDGPPACHSNLLHTADEHMSLVGGRLLTIVEYFTSFFSKKVTSTRRPRPDHDRSACLLVTRSLLGHGRTGLAWRSVSDHCHIWQGDESCLN